MVGLASPLASFGTVWVTVYLSNEREWSRVQHESDLKEAEFENWEPQVTSRRRNRSQVADAR
jgi:hypothetical protein